MTDAKWKALREAFPEDEIELLPKPYSKDSPKGKCKDCGGFHGLPAVHLSYVGHAGLTMRLDAVVGPGGWSWEPFALDPAGLPAMGHGGMWIRLSILDVTKIGFGDAQGKTGPSATKEIIGDALRNAAMRFGIGTYLWSKSDKAHAILARQGADVEEVPDRFGIDAYTPSEGLLKQVKGEAWAAAQKAGLDLDAFTAELRTWSGVAEALPSELADVETWRAFTAHLQSIDPTTAVESEREKAAREAGERDNS